MILTWHSAFFLFSFMLLVGALLAHEDPPPPTLVARPLSSSSPEDPAFLHAKEDPHKHPHSCGHKGLDREQAMIETARVQAAIAKQNTQSTNHGRHLQTALLTDDCAKIVQACRQCISIKMNLHLTTFTRSGYELIPHPTQSIIAMNQGQALTVNDFSSMATIQQLFADNIDVVNKAFEETPFSFVWDPIDTTVSNNATWVDAVASYQADISAAVGSGDLRQMDVFLGFRVTDPRISGENSTGMASFASVQRAGVGDGVYLRYDVLTGGGFPGYDEGYYLVHEIGHWLGLFYTYEQILPETKGNPCNPAEAELNDLVDDTPMMRGPSDVVLDDSCTEYLNGKSLPDSCPDIPGVDPLFNYMNSLDQNVCWKERGEFSCQQIERMYKQWLLFRDPVTMCNDPVQEGEIELIFVIDERYAEDQITILLYNEEDEELFNSFSDHLFYYNKYPDMSILEVDLCVPRGETYTVNVRDNLAGDGFTSGILSIYVDGDLEETLQGNFSTFNTTIQFPLRTYAPSKSPSAAPSPVPTTAHPSARPSFPPTSYPTPTSAPTETRQRVIFPTDSTSRSPGLIGERWIIWICTTVSLIGVFD